MNCELPTVIRVGHFDSRRVIVGMTETTPRVPEIYELEMFTEDTGIAYLDGEERNIRKGDVALVKPGSVRWSILPVQCYYVHFTADDANLISVLDSMSGFAHVQHYSAIEALFHNIRGSFIAVDPMAPTVTASRLMELLWQLRQHGETSVEVHKKDPISRAVRIIQRKFRNDITVEMLAEECNLSVSYFHKLFLQTTGVTPNRYLIMTRLTAAKNMLLSSDQPVAQVAEYCGFSSQGYFCDCMKKYTGMSPRQFRRNANYPKD